VYAAAFWVFFSCVQYTRLQWNTGVRYMVPVIPLVFLLTAAVLVRLPRGFAYVIGMLALVQSWSLTMVRDAPLESLTKVLLGGLELPWLTVLTKMAPQYAPFLAKGASPMPLFLICSVLIYGIWRIPSPWQPLSVTSVQADVEATPHSPGRALDEQVAPQPSLPQ